LKNQNYHNLKSRRKRQERRSITFYKASEEQNPQWLRQQWVCGNEEVWREGRVKMLAAGGRNRGNLSHRRESFLGSLAKETALASPGGNKTHATAMGGIENKGDFVGTKP